MEYADKCGFCNGTGTWDGEDCPVCGGVGFYVGPGQDEHLICPHCGCLNDGQDLVNDMNTMEWEAEFDDVKCMGCGKEFTARVHLELVATYTTRKERSV